MKNIKILMNVAFLAIGIFVLTSCSSDHNHNADGSHTTTTTIKHGEGQAFNAAYVCPMHCAGSGAAKAGKCPTCKMNYVAVTDHVKDGHKHNNSHDGHNHGAHDGHDHSGHDHSGHNHGDHEGHNHN